MASREIEDAETPLQARERLQSEILEQGPEFGLDQTIEALADWMMDSVVAGDIEATQSAIYWLQFLSDASKTVGDAARALSVIHEEPE